MNEPAPSWDTIHEVANGQSGHFTSEQASDAGFSPQLLHKHLNNGNLERPMRGVYRITRFPPSEHEDLVVFWLWSNQTAVFSHETALSLHELSDALPAKLHLTLPTTTSRRKQIPQGVIAHFADLPPVDQQWLGPVRITRPARTVLDVASSHGDAALVSQAIDDGIRRSLFTFTQVAPAGRYVANAQGWGTPIRPDGVDGFTANLGDRFYTAPMSGTSTKPPPPDWPALAAELGRSLGAQLRYAERLPTQVMQLEFAWRASRIPSDADVSTLHRQLKVMFSWA